jgi:hypothetical protein
MLREEYTLGVFENKALWRIFGPNKDKVAGGWRKLHDDELRSLYCHQILFFAQC